jgi:hypothetical protein
MPSAAAANASSCGPLIDAPWHAITAATTDATGRSGSKGVPNAFER